MWKDAKGRFGVSGLEDPENVMSDAFRRSLDVLIDHGTEAVVGAVEEARSEFVAAEAAIAADPLVEAEFKDVRPPTSLLRDQVGSVDELRDLILQVDRRWQLDAMVALEDYLESEKAARQLRARWEESKTDGQQLDVSISSVERAWKKSGFDDFWLVLRTGTGDLAALKVSISAADDAAAREGADIQGYTVTPCPGGFAIEIGPALEPEQIRLWIQHLAQALQHHGITGRLSGAPQARGREVLEASLQPTPTLFARFTLPPTLAAGKPQWEVDAAQTHQIVHTTLDWAQTVPGEVILTQASFSVRVDGTELQAPMERALHAAARAGVDVFDQPVRRARHAVLGPQAVALFQTVGTSWQDTIEELRELATSLPPPLDLAFVRTVHRGALGVWELDTAQPLPGIREHHVRYNMHLLDRYVPDAHGIQIVSDAHLHAAHDLSDWSITDLGHGRHLVAAHDLEPWYSTTRPDPDTLARARTDWAGALLTEDVIAANPRD